MNIRGELETCKTVGININGQECSIQSTEKVLAAYNATRLAEKKLLAMGCSWEIIEHALAKELKTGQTNKVQQQILAKWYDPTCPDAIRLTAEQIAGSGRTSATVGLFKNSPLNIGSPDTLIGISQARLDTFGSPLLKEADRWFRPDRVYPSLGIGPELSNEIEDPLQAEAVFRAMACVSIDAFNESDIGIKHSNTLDILFLENMHNEPFNWQWLSDEYKSKTSSVIGYSYDENMNERYIFRTRFLDLAKIKQDIKALL